ncbi:MAG TPA: tetratricopeptide repeat protein [Methylomirabilota bacterium]|nr:tetratricopeptide repeat protein [Methylomirabilota bacterium]
MAFLRLLFLTLFALVLSGGQIFAASSAKEDRAFAAATAAFQAKIWSRSEMEFAQFMENFPNSTNASQAMLLQAQSEFQQKKFGEAVALLKSNQSKAKNLEDQYVYWTGESQFAGGNFLSASDTFVSLAQNFPKSSLAVRGIVEAASAQAQSKNWPQVESLLEETNGIFQYAAQADSAGETVARGHLLLAQAKFEQTNFDGAAAILEAINSQTLSPQLDWQRADLLCRVKMSAGDFPAALAASTNLLQIANFQRDDNLLAESRALRADLLAKMNLSGDAIAVYSKNLTNAPVKWQRQAILKIAEISLAQNQLTNAGQKLADFLQQFSNSSVADMALLTLGEMHLKSYAANHSATNELQAAQTNFDQFLGAFANSPLAGKAFLDRGWCNWFAQKIPESLADFKSAAQQLPPSEDLAVAKFKLADAQFAEQNFAGARTNYNAVVNDFTDFPDVVRSLGAQALYQSLRASLELNDPTNASIALSKLLKHFYSSELMPNAELLYAEGLGDFGKPAAARETFQNFEQQWPNSNLKPQVEFAVAHTYELEKNWPAAITNYEHWLAEFPTNELLPRASYALAWANFQAGNETNAVALFANFVAQFPTNELAPQAQWWLGDYFYGQKNFTGAETNYERVYQDWPASDLAHPARLMAGRAAAGRSGYHDAIKYFQDAISDTNCPADVAVQAQFAWGNALMSYESSITNNPLANFQFATNVFVLIVQKYPTNDFGALALCYIGDCAVQLANYDAATNTYAQVFSTNSMAGISLRCRAQIGFGMTLEKKAELVVTGDDKNALLHLALDNYFDAFETGYGKNLRDDETAREFWVKEAGLRALPLMQSLRVAPPEGVDGFITEMEGLLPQLKDSLEKKRAEFSQIKN